MKNSFNGLLSTLDMAKKRISEFEDRSVEISQLKYKEKKKKIKTNRTPKKSGTILKCVNICVYAISEYEEKENGAKNVYDSEL